ncbi:adenylate/guanylate cyclase domain-containing protein [Hwanghaeella sp.]|uniref:adenylate/guanylate cyclase domain-containing protein n=1 Tax=Hwanghaeella sp. TaxID=2605943 RepID=UPI003CCBE783
MTTTDWKIEPVVDWLLTDGRKCQDLESIASGLAGALVATGAPIMRMVMTFRTLHPQFAAERVLWERGEGMISHRRSDHGIWNTDAYKGSPIEIIVKTGEPFHRKLKHLDKDRDHPVLFELAASGVTDYYGLAIPFTFHRQSTFLVNTDIPDGFTETDIAKFNRIVLHLAPIVEVLVTHNIAVGLLDTYLGPRTGKKVFAGLIKRGDGEEIDAALWFSDLREFTRLTESLPPADVLDLLNAYFEHVHTAVTVYGGEILRFIGDAMLIVFPVDEDKEIEAARRDACRAALDAAVDAFSSLAVLNRLREREGKPAIRFGVGLHFGHVIYGNVGAPGRLDFTVMGPAVNRTARLESLTKDLEIPLLLSQEMGLIAAVPVTPRGEHMLKGVAVPQSVVSYTAFDEAFDIDAP